MCSARAIDYNELAEKQFKFNKDCQELRVESEYMLMNLDLDWLSITDTWHTHLLDKQALERLIQLLLISLKRGRILFLCEAWKIFRIWIPDITQTSFLTIFPLTRGVQNCSYIFAIRIFLVQSGYSGTLSLFRAQSGSGLPTTVEKLSSHSWQQRISKPQLIEGLPFSCYVQGTKSQKPYDGSYSNEVLTKILDSC